MSNIKKAKLLKKADYLDLEFMEARPGFNSASEMGGRFYDPIHDDLKNGFLSLRRHYAALYGFVDPMKVNVMELTEDFLKDFYVSSFQYVREGAAIMLTGHRIIWNGKAANGTSPAEEIEVSESPTATAYPHLDDLLNCVGNICTEIDLYLGGKRPEAEPKPQGELPFTGEPVTHMQVLPPKGEEFLGQKLEEPEIKTEKPETAAQRKKRVAQSAANPSGIVAE